MTDQQREKRPVDLSRALETLQSMPEVYDLDEEDVSALNVAIDALTALGHPGFGHAMRTTRGWECRMDGHQRCDFYRGTTPIAAIQQAAAAIREQTVLTGEGNA